MVIMVIIPTIMIVASIKFCYYATNLIITFGLQLGYFILFFMPSHKKAVLHPFYFSIVRIIDPINLHIFFIITKMMVIPSMVIVTVVDNYFAVIVVIIVIVRAIIVILCKGYR